MCEVKAAWIEILLWEFAWDESGQLIGLVGVFFRLWCYRR